MAVGWSAAAAGARSPLLLRWAGGSWQVLDGPGLLGSAELAAVSCWNGQGCLAVGVREAARTQAVLAETWDGTSWRLTGPVQPPGAATARFYGVWCRAARSCMAVGDYAQRSGRVFSLAEVWSGNRWRVLTVPSPSAGISAVLDAVWCADAMCLAVGKYTPHSGPCTCRILAEGWNGGRWEILSTPEPVGPRLWSALQAISCTSVTVCLAVGTAQSTTLGSTPIAEQWQSGTWRVVPIPNLIRMLGGDLDGVSCAGRVGCLAVGSVLGSGPIAARWDGARWQDLSVPSSVPETLNAVSCAAGSCIAVGSINDARQPYPRPLTVRWGSS